MRYFDLLNLQHIFLFLFPTLTFIILLYAGLAYAHFRKSTGESEENPVINKYPDGIEEKNGPFPLILMLTIVGTFLWAFFYILGMGIYGVKI